MASSRNYGLIMAGGRGTRFWPKSRTAQAKQVLSFGGDRTLIQQTVDRLGPVLPPENIWIVTNDHLRAEIVKQLPEVPKRQILSEPAQRNTAPCIGLAAHILQSIDPDSVMGVFPADHMITRPARYLRLLKPAFGAAARGQIAVIGIQPRWAETGYGYIEFGKGMQAGHSKPIPVLSFREKPDGKTAAKFVRSGRFYWNAGMFFWRTDVLLQQLREHLPISSGLIESLPKFDDRRFGARLKDVFPKCENISIDYAVLERATNVVGLPAGDIGWNDVGSWNAIYDMLPRDADGNSIGAQLLSLGSRGNLVDAGGKLVALLGVEDLVIVDTADALLVASRERAQEVGALVKELERRKRDDLL